MVPHLVVRGKRWFHNACIVRGKTVKLPCFSTCSGLILISVCDPQPRRTKTIPRCTHTFYQPARLFALHSVLLELWFFSSWSWFLKKKKKKYCYLHSTVILKEYFENIPLKSSNIAKIFIELLERFLKYCRNLAMSVQNIINGILLQY